MGNEACCLLLPDARFSLAPPPVRPDWQVLKKEKEREKIGVYSSVCSLPSFGLVG